MGRSVFILEKQSYRKRSLIVFIKQSFSNTIDIYFLNVQKEGVVFKNDSFRKRSKNEKKRSLKRLITLLVMRNYCFKELSKCKYTICTA